MGEDIIARLQNDFTYHKPPAEKQEVFIKIREKAKELAMMIAKECPRGREQSSAFTNLEQAVMHANAGIARQYPIGQEYDQPNSTVV